jgi:ABC-type proline/glycine betaine transport system ATPase subunit
MARKAKPVETTEVVEVVETTEVVEVVETTEVVETPKTSLVSNFIKEVEKTAEVVEVVEIAEVKKERNEGVGQFIRNLIQEGLSNKQILSIVHEQYGNQNTTYACIAWYRNKMRKAGSEVRKTSALDFITNFAKTNGLSEEAVQELSRKFG